MEHYKIYSLKLELAYYSECIKIQLKENYRTLFLMNTVAEICNKVLVNQIWKRNKGIKVIIKWASSQNARFD